VPNKSLHDAIADKCRNAVGNTAPLRAKKHQTLSPTEAMFVLAVDGMTGSPMSGLTEESLTANFAGRLAAQYAWAVECIGTGGDKAALWGEYSKNGQGHDSESRRGADFALVVPINAQEVKVAIFQAKKARREQVNIGQAGSKTAQEPQLDKLFETAKTISLASGIADEASLSWVHYVFWREAGNYPKSISLAQLEPILQDPAKVDTSHTAFGSFADLLLAVKTKKDIAQGTPAVVAGWLLLGIDEARDFLPKLHALTDVIFADEEGEGRVFANLLDTNSEISLFAEVEPVDPKSIVAHEAGTVQSTRHIRKNF
jgi:hypothetical protein